jgi:hypothetical protein
MRGWLLVAFVLGGCRATFVDERGGAGGAEAGIDVSELPPGVRVGGGRFLGRAGHVAAGAVELWDHDGVAEVRLAADFSISDVPGPVVVLTTRDGLGTAIDPVAGDVEVAELRAPMGAQTYFGRVDGLRPTRVFVFCKPYGLEVGKAELRDP